MPRGSQAALPRLWLPRTAKIAPGAVAASPAVESAVAALLPLRDAPLAARVRTVAVGSELTLVLRNGVEVRLGEPTRLALKLEVARRVVPLVTPETRYVDVSVPERAVAGTAQSNPQVEG